MNIEQIIKNNKGTVVDVRTREEFMGGHVEGSINIPLNEVPEKVNEFKKMAAPVVLCCASGGRSGNAQQYLSQLGVDCVNAGSWLSVNFYQSQKI
jgi:phage shock protein E